jgi:hypothetical protein
MKLGEDQHLPTRPTCLSCGKLLDGVTGVGADGLPGPGDFSLCAYCGHIMVFTDDLMLREPTGKEIHEIAGDERILMIQRARKRMGEE